jgi:signal transduction histidine kinase
VTALTLAACGWLAAGGLGAAQLRLRGRLVAVARASHELRGPLFAARLGLHALAVGAASARVAAIDLELRRAALALEDLEGAPRGRGAPSRVAIVDVAGLVRDSAAGWRALAGGHGARLAVELPAAPARVHGDRLRLAQACANLVANAAEHGGGLVRVTVAGAGGSVRVEVRDDGSGLPAPVCALTAAARGRRGRRGHGLAIAAAVAEAHGGRLAAAPARAGARVVLELPAAGAAAPVAHAPRRRVRRRRPEAGRSFTA